MAYDVSLGGIALPTFEQDFSETLGSDYTLVGSAVMPGPPRPAAMYSFTLNIYGDGNEPDRTTAGFTKRGQVKSMLQNAATRYAGVAFTVAFDSALNGYLVIGTADLSYNIGGATFGDFQLRVGNAVWISAPLTIQAMVTRPTALDESEARFYLPVGAKEIVGQIDPVLPELKTYKTMEGTGYYVKGRKAGEVIRYRQNWEDVLKGDVKIWDRRGNVPHKTTYKHDVDPTSYGWAQAYGPLWVFPEGDAPVMENGVCRVSWTGGDITVESFKKGVYVPQGTIQTGYSTVGRPFIVSWTPQEGVVRVPVVGGARRQADVYVRLARGWTGPEVTIDHLGDRPTSGVEGMDAHSERIDRVERYAVGPEATVRGTTEHRIFRAAT